MQISIRLTPEEARCFQSKADEAGEGKTGEELLLERLNAAGAEYLAAIRRDMCKADREAVLAAMDDPVKLAAMREAVK